MIGTILHKDNEEEMSAYTDCAVWCNANNATIEDKGEYYEIVEIQNATSFTEDKIAQLDAQYQQDKKTLQEYYVSYMIAGDTEGQESIKEELEALATQYDADLAELEGGED